MTERQCEHPGHCEGDWPEEGHVHTVYGQSGQYTIIWDDEGEVIRDDRPWQMKV